MIKGKLASGECVRERIMGDWVVNEAFTIYDDSENESFAVNM